MFKKIIPNYIILYSSIYQYIVNVKYVLDANLWSIHEKNIYIRVLQRLVNYLE